MLGDLRCAPDDPNKPLILTEEERERLQSLAHRARSQPLLARRARVVLACGEGLDNQAVAKQAALLAGHGGQVARRFLKARLEGLYDEPRPGAPRKSAMRRWRKSSYRRWKARRAGKRIGAREDWRKPPDSAA